MSLLGAAGLGDWIARDDEDFVRIAIDLAVDRASLESWRGSLRASLLASPLLDARGYALRLHAALRAARADVA
jgi:predicted O-linked N-acetylglucosamine transferase (SPINDLY family)